MFQGLPRTLIAFGVVVIAIVEIATRLPDLMLIPPRLEGQVGEYGAKALQPEVVTTQVAKTQADTRLADTQAQLNAIQQQKIAAETKLAQTQAALAAAQAMKTQAETQLAQAQTAKTNIDTAQSGLGLAMTVGILGVGAKFLGAFGHSQDAQQATQQQPDQQPASPFEAGRADWHKWHDWEQALSGDKLAGVQFWAQARSQKPRPSCTDGRGQSSTEFQEGCTTAAQFLEVVDRWRLSNSDYRQGWNAGAKETGDF